MKNLAAIVLSLLATTALSAQDNTSSLYGTGEWNADSLGNHRVVVSIEKPSDAVLAKLDWRRRDLQPEAKDLYIIDAQTGKRIENVFRFAVNREEGDIGLPAADCPWKILHLLHEVRHERQRQLSYGEISVVQRDGFFRMAEQKQAKFEEASEVANSHNRAISVHQYSEFLLPDGNHRYAEREGCTAEDNA